MNFQRKMYQDKDYLIIQLYARSPAPLRDYAGLAITNQEIVLNIWNVSKGPHVFPKRHRCSMKEVKDDTYAKEEIVRIFGEHVYKYVLSASRNEKRLENLPSKVFRQILRCLAARDIVHLSQTSKVFFELCNDEKVWRLLFEKYFGKQPDNHETLMGKRLGWKEIFKKTLQKKNDENKKNKRFQLTASKRGRSVNLGTNNKSTNKIQVKKEANIGINPARKETLFNPKHIIDNGRSSIFTDNFDAINGRVISSKSMTNLNNLTKSNLSQQKSKSNIKVNNNAKVNNLKMLKNTNIKIEVPKELQTSIDHIRNTANIDKNTLRAITVKNCKVGIVNSDVLLVKTRDASLRK